MLGLTSDSPIGSDCFCDRQSEKKVKFMCSFFVVVAAVILIPLFFRHYSISSVLFV